MKKMLSNYRYYVLVLLTAVALLGIMSVPQEDMPLPGWCLVLVSSKAIGFCAGYAAYLLARRWEKQGAIPELMNYVNNH